MRGGLLWLLFTMLTPPSAHLGLGILIATRIAMGMGEAVAFPSIYSIYGHWRIEDSKPRFASDKTDDVE